MGRDASPMNGKNLADVRFEQGCPAASLPPQ
jgi:hypothetical protein